MCFVIVIVIVIVILLATDNNISGSRTAADSHVTQTPTDSTSLGKYLHIRISGLIYLNIYLYMEKHVSTLLYAYVFIYASVRVAGWLCVCVFMCLCVCACGGAQVDLNLHSAPNQSDLRCSNVTLLGHSNHSGATCHKLICSRCSGARVHTHTQSYTEPVHLE